MKRVKCYYVLQVIVYRDMSESVYVIRQDSVLRPVRSFFSKCCAYSKGLDSSRLLGDPYSYTYKLCKMDIEEKITLIDSFTRNF